MVGASGFEPLTTRTPSLLDQNQLARKIEKYWISLDLFCRDHTQENAAFPANNEKVLTKVLTRFTGRERSFPRTITLKNFYHGAQQSSMNFSAPLLPSPAIYRRFFSDVIFSCFL